MESILYRTVFTVFCIFAGPALAKAAYEEYLQQKKITFGVFTGVFWSVCHFFMVYVLAADKHRLFDDQTAIIIVLFMYTVMLVIYLLQLVLTTIKRFRTKEYVTGIGMVIVCIFFAMFTSVPPLILYHMS